MAIDLSKLSREEKLAMIDALEEKGRRALAKRENFIPNAGQLPVIGAFASDAIETVLVLTGNGGGKTALGTNLAIYSAGGFVPQFKRHLPVPSRIIVVLDKPEKVTDVWLAELSKWYPLEPSMLHKRGKPYISQITFANGSELLFMFHDQEPMAFESVEGDVFIFDEPPPRHVFIALRRAGRKKGRKPKYVIIGTPIAAPWLRSELYEPWARGERPEVACFRFSTEVNKANLSDGYIESFSAYLSEKERRIRLDGEFFDLEGLALAPLFKRHLHVMKPFDWPTNWPVVISVDPHPSKAHYAIALGVNPNERLFVLRELRNKGGAREFADALFEWARGLNVVDVVCDSLGSSDTTGGDGRLSFISVCNTRLKELGARYRLRATTFKEKEDEAWIQAIQNVLVLPEKPDNFGATIPRLRLFEGKTNGLISDIESVKWLQYRNLDEYKPKLDITNKDYLSCLKYALATQPRWRTGRDVVIKARNPSPWGGRPLARRPR